MIYFIPTPLGNMSDISMHALQALNDSAIILCEDTRVTKKLISLLAREEFIRTRFPDIFTNKRFFSFHSHNQEHFLQNINKEFFQDNIAFCTDAGSPCISDPGAILIQYAREHNIAYEILLGGCAFSHAFIQSALDGPFCFMGFLPSKKQDRISVLRSHMTLHNHLHIIYYESPHRLIESIQDMDSVYQSPRFYVYKELTKLYEREIIGNKHEILSALGKSIRGEYCIIVQRQEISDNVLHLSKEDILALDMNNKQKSKLLAQITPINAKQWYKILQSEK